MRIQVRCRRSGGEDLPAGLRLGARFLPVVHVLQRWEKPGGRCFRVQVLDGREFVICQEALGGDWALERVAA